jgi:microcin C transport system substrate-binding protein
MRTTTSPEHWRGPVTVLSLLALGLFLLAGCGKPAATAAVDPRQVGPPVKDEPVTLASDGELDPIASPDAVKGGTLFTWAEGYPKSLNMWLEQTTTTIEVGGLLFEPLIGIDPVKDEPIGIIAKSWTISDDKKIYTFHLNPEAKWSDGRPVTAEDIQFYYDTMMNPKNLTSVFRVDLQRFARPEVIDAKTVRIVANEAHWNNFWAAGGLFAFPKHAWEGKDFNELNFEFPVVSGPYRLQQALTNRSITLQRRGDWWGRNLRTNQH